jgi:RNA polymerase sigma-70 factor (ECF subfamily)
MSQKEFTRRITELMEKHKQELFRYACYRVANVEDAEDILQDVYLRMLERGSEAAKVENLHAYVFRALVNACNSHALSPDFIPLTCAEVLDISEQPQSFEDEATRIAALVDAMPEHTREAVRLKIFASMTFCDIAATLGFSETTAKRRYYEGLEYLRLKLNNTL